MATILVVDDEPDIRLLTKLNLERDGHRVTTADDGVAALAEVARSRPDLILLDVMMPELDGWSVLEQLKAASDQATAEIPVVMLTALGGAMDRAKGGIEGAVRYLTKPIDIDELRRTITEALAAPEPPQRRNAQHKALEMLARIERNAPPSSSDSLPRPRLSGLEHDRSRRRAPEPPPALRIATERLGALTDKQRELLDAVQSHATVLEAATTLGMSRSNIYASLRRISRRLGTASVPELLELLRTGTLDLHPTTTPQ